MPRLNPWRFLRWTPYPEQGTSVPETVTASSAVGLTEKGGVAQCLAEKARAVGWPATAQPVPRRSTAPKTDVTDWPEAKCGNSD